ncbi:MAG: sugar ABC transporter ATP-binding protein [Rhodospirillales bacterium]|nr:sugar ABC transporter ATP-binding protein [Rhodospirillales bacterium]
MSAVAPAAPVMSLRGVCKAFAGVQALAGVDFDLRPGEVHALLGENGAGKSTLMKVLFGVVRPDQGKIVLDGTQLHTIAGPRHALALGIGLVSQELSLVPQLEVAQNIFLGQARVWHPVQRRRLRARAAALLQPLAPEIDVAAPVGALGMAARQVVEIARTLARGGRIIAFDEPTSSLTPTERDRLFAIIRDLKAAGRGIVYISHRMPEIYAIADRITVLRDGRVVAEGPPAKFPPDELNSLIAGRRLAEAQERGHVRTAAPGAEALRLQGVANARLRGIDLTLRRGEILGIAGLVGSGRSALARCIFGVDPATEGQMMVDGRPATIHSPAAARAAGIGLIPEDRRGQALVPLMDVEQNFGLGNEALFARLGVIRRALRRHETARAVEELAIRPRRTSIRIRGLSGGNQQKVVIARWLRSGAHILLFDEPTRGIDVGAKAEIHAIMRRLATEGNAVVVISSELPELLMLADRIAVMHDGRVNATLDNTADLTEEKLMRLAAATEGLA